MLLSLLPRAAINFELSPRRFGLPSRPCALFNSGVLDCDELPPSPPRGLSETPNVTAGLLLCCDKFCCVGIDDSFASSLFSLATVNLRHKLKIN
ncbi:hypothetical protein AYI69_g3525 [Smittium culicis]|uniref:Uncharacterized protein n=1 Tax=Smittium culicis TaxID=133412 RepID=A0A1R1YJF2_9FUNG|nr:hypothetical protein AYI69_g3525 [Smittium culicis]